MTQRDDGKLCCIPGSNLHFLFPKEKEETPIPRTIGRPI